MRRKRLRRSLFAITILILCLGFPGCEYPVPITSSPTSKIDERLLGQWYGDKGEPISIGRKDEYNYVITLGAEKYPAYHSDVKTQTGGISLSAIRGENRFVNLLVSGKYSYLTYKLEEHGNVIKVGVVSSEIIPTSVTNSARIQQLLEENLQNPKLFRSYSTYAHEAPIRKSQLMNALRQLRRRDSQADIVNQIRIRGVDFQLTPTIQRELEDAGARQELVDTTRNNFRGSKKT
jgi:hypothetical protein